MVAIFLDRLFLQKVHLLSLYLTNRAIAFSTNHFKLSSIVNVR
ncbi:hypothetical protein [Cyanobacterium sp. Dongsha4]|nr:hypothetical protein [Cyanobacterium sp. Dongsha4]